MVETTENLVERLSKAKAKIEFLVLQKEQQDRDRAKIMEELGTLGIKDPAELENKIAVSKAEIEDLRAKFDAALTKLEKSTADLEAKVR